MISAGWIIDKVARDSNRESNTDDRDYIRRLLNNQYFEMCAELSWATLRRQPIEIDLSDASYDSGMWLPSNILGIDRVRDEDGIEYLPKDPAEIDSDDSGYRYVAYVPDGEPLVYGEDFDITTGTNGPFDFTGYSSATHDLQYVAIDEEPGVWQIDDSGEKKLTTYYYGPTKSGVGFRVRPEFTKKIICYDSSGDEVTDKEISVWTWVMPRPLYKDNDPIIFPIADPLILRVLREMPEAKSRRPVNQQEIENAFKKCASLNPDFPRHNNPRDRRNNVFKLVNSPFTGRD
jgi:hypothetical protein